MKLVTVLIWSNLSAYNPTIIPNDPINNPPKNKYTNHKRIYCMERSIKNINIIVEAETMNKHLADDANVIANTTSDAEKGKGTK